MSAAAGVARAAQRGRVMLWLLCAMYFLFYVDRVNIATTATSIQRDLGLTNTELGLAFSAFAYPYAFFQVFGGWIGDRFGSRRTLIACGLVVAVTTVLTGLAGGLGSLFAVRMALGFGEGAAFPTATRAMSSWLPPSRWGYAQGITHSAARLGNAVTPPLISALILALSWRASFYIMGAASLVWVLAWVFLLPADEPRTRVTPGAAKQATPWPELIRRILPVTAVDFCYGWMLWLFLNWLPSFFQNEYHQDLKSSAIFSSGVFLAGVVGDTAGGVVSDRILARTGSRQLARGWLIAGAFLFTLAFMLPLLFAHEVSQAAISLGLAFFALEFIVAPIWSVPMDIAPAHAGKASGLMNLGFGIAGIISPYVVGVIIDATGNRTLPFLVSMVLLVLGALLALRMHPDRPLA
ncbi:MAG TPA: MFS transporter [Acetobacteraceae bacterium]|nr:MFS transporter [Acetobacteraceae bacterium]